MKQIIVTFEVNDDFIPGQCTDCPFATMDDDYNYICPFGWYYDNCYVEVK